MQECAYKMFRYYFYLLTWISAWLNFKFVLWRFYSYNFLVELSISRKSLANVHKIRDGGRKEHRSDAKRPQVEPTFIKYLRESGFYILSGILETSQRRCWSNQKPVVKVFLLQILCEEQMEKIRWVQWVREWTRIVRNIGTIGGECEVDRFLRI